MNEHGSAFGVGAAGARRCVSDEQHLLAGAGLTEAAAQGIAAPSFQAAWEAHRREIVYGFFIFLINETRFQTEAINTAYTARFGAAALDHGTVELTNE